MSSTTAAPAGAGTAGNGLVRLRGNRALVGIVAAVLVTLVALTVVAARTARGGDLDPANPDPAGARAVARVLAAQGVQVDVVRRADDLDRARVDAGTTVVVTSSNHLGRFTARRLVIRAAAAGQLVLAAPGPTLLRALGLPLVVEDARADRRTAAGCDDVLLGDLTVDVGPSAGYRSADPAVTGCFAGRGRHPASLVVRADRDVPTYAVAGVGLLTNERVRDADNAAAALRLLGAHERLVWYVPDVRDIATGDTGSLAGQLPRGLVPALWLVAAAVLATMLWRGRRLGALVLEPLPVVVKAAESTHGRARLYRRVRDPSHAAAILRDATCRRLTAHLRLAPGADPDALASAVASATGADRAAVLDLLARRPVPDDPALTRLAADLASLEREVHPR